MLREVMERELFERSELVEKEEVVRILIGVIGTFRNKETLQSELNMLQASLSDSGKKLLLFCMTSVMLSIIDR